ncbi:hypothetical protein D3C87_1935560 [compost metagenome]
MSSEFAELLVGSFTFLFGEAFVLVQGNTNWSRTKHLLARFLVCHTPYGDFLRVNSQVGDQEYSFQ